MPKAKLVTIVCWSVSALALIALAGWFLFRVLSGGTGISFRPSALSGPFEPMQVCSLPLEGITGISVDWISGAASILPYDGDTVQITEYARRELAEKERMQTEVKDGILTIHYTANALFLNPPEKKLELLVPAALAQNLDALRVTATSADLTISGFRAASLTIKETSGFSHLSDLRAQQAELSSVSGGFSVSGLVAASLQIGSVSGDILLSDAEAGQLTTDSTSGEQQLSGTFRHLAAKSVSGGISVVAACVPDSADCGTTSGAINFTLPGDMPLDVKYRTTSGQFTSEIPVRTAGSEAPYQFYTVSGNIALLVSK